MPSIRAGIFTINIKVFTRGDDSLFSKKTGKVTEKSEGEINMSHLQIAAFVLPLVFLVYQIVIDFANLYPFNDIRSRDQRLRKYEVLGN